MYLAYFLQILDSGCQTDTLPNFNQGIRAASL